MGRYLLHRFLWMLVIILVTAFVIFTILYFTPGDPAVALLGPNATDAELMNLRVTLGLERPYLVQLGEFFYNTFIRFDFGTSWVYNVPVYEELAKRLPYTVFIGCSAMAFNLALGLLFGVFAGTHEGKWQDSVTMAIAMIFVSCPDFWVALMLIVLFAKELSLLPAYGVSAPGWFILPIFCSALSGVANNSRQERSSILEVFRSDFITTARAKGVPERRVVMRHMFPNSLMPIISTIGNGFARIVCGSAVIESIFSIPGVGLYMLTAINSRDYPAVRASVLFFATFTAVVMLLVDLIYAAVDPRIKSQYGIGKRV